MKQDLRLFWLRTIVLILAVAAQNALANETYKFDATRSTIGFRVHQFLGTTNGKFTQFSGNIEIDRQHPESSSVSARIQVNSVNTGIQKRDDHLRSPDFFNAAKFPEITFKSRSVRETGTESADILGDLTMHGITKRITLHVKLITPVSDQARTRWEVATEPIKRSDFGLMFGSATEALSGISQNVAIKIEIEAVKVR